MNLIIDVTFLFMTGLSPADQGVANRPVWPDDCSECSSGASTAWSR